jgi:DNA excision repair protein ERCC-2
MEIITSVRSLVEFILRSGDIDNRKAAAPENAMQEGGRIHRMLQRRMGADYHAEVTLKYSYHTPKYDILVEGRADGIIDGQLAKRIIKEVPVCFEEREGKREKAGRRDKIERAAEAEEVIKVKGEAAKGDIETVIETENVSGNDVTGGTGAEISQDQYPDRIGDTVVIDEIKGTYADVSRMKAPVMVHLAQAKCYAYIYAKQNSLPFIRVRMTYCNIETEELQYFFRDYRLQDLEKWFEGLMKSYQKWADYEVEWKEKRQQSIRQMDFPFPYREGQKELITYVYQTLYHKRKLFIEAPTGVGKTLSTVFPSVKAVGEGMAEKLFYLTAKTITRTVAEEAFSILRERGLLFKTVILTARDKICFLEEAECNPVACPYAKGHFDRINDAVYDMLTHEVSFTRELIEAYAQKHRVCPFEMCLDMSLFADGVICDYNYVFDPHVYLKRFFAEGAGREYIFLVDEAHNLVDRGREMYSAELRKEDFLELKKEVRIYDKKMGSLLERCNRQLLTYKKECETYKVLESIDPFILAVNKLAAQMERFLEDHDDSPVRKAVLEFYFEISHFLLIYDKLDDKYVMYDEMQDDGSFLLKLFCVDPSGNLEECMMRARSSILFSATFLPIQYYKSLLGGEKDDYEVYAASVFSPKKRGLFIGSDITSKYTRRGPGEYFRAASYIKEITAQKKGNYLIFFPSHAFLKQVYEVYLEAFYEEEREICILQETRMGEKEREDFLRKFSRLEESSGEENFTEENLAEEILTEEILTEKNLIIEEELMGEDLIRAAEPVKLEDIQNQSADSRSLLGFCVLGGIFSEGIDLKQDRLIGAVIVGTGLPQVCNEREIIRRYFDKQSENGFDYAYQYPGMNKVLQAAGRVIRTVDDIGIVALLDERFLQRSYQRMFPREWKDYQVTTCNHAAFHVGEFWKLWE